MPPPPQKKKVYRLRSGAFCKVKYPMAIYKENEIPSKDTTEMLEMALQVRREEATSADEHDRSYQMWPKAEHEKKNPSMKSTMKFASDPTVPSCVPKSKKPCGGNKSENELRTPGFSLVSDNLYRSAYPSDDSMPPFPVESSSAFQYSRDSGESGEESDYDMDSEDEEWLMANRQFNITPNRLEYIFSKLNKRNTHVPEKAIGALPASVHRDFNHLFPYWKEKRLQNKNYSSFKSHSFFNRDCRLPLGYVSTDPHNIFNEVRKSIPQRSQPPSKILCNIREREKTLICYQRMTELREKLGDLRSLYMPKLEEESLNKRDKIARELDNFTRAVSQHDNNVEVKATQAKRKRGLETSRTDETHNMTRVTRRLSTESNSQSQTLRALRSNSIKLNSLGLSTLKSLKKTRKKTTIFEDVFE